MNEEQLESRSLLDLATIIRESKKLGIRRNEVDLESLTKMAGSAGLSKHLLNRVRDRKKTEGGRVG